ncbi:glyceraldehyde-3-phosphate dehydrogenase-like [Copidosoma floridanum]|uniref:glyceraldehyde-3-phosphate dehydrogenase-like n=1 Tax=Copidosoma floridanum TaxID=29053 RepID=UPI0006C95308|nr:glyceraldehyde-3-phosphate dehydrogenase-like [Copidosoma floridanum]
MVTVGINGFGRIGRNCLKICLEKNIEVKHINDPFIQTDYMIYLFKYDSTHGVNKLPIRCEDNSIVINDKGTITTSCEKDPTKIKWEDAGVRFVIEATGIFKELEKAQMHRKAGAEFVVITAPSNDVPTFIYGVNHHKYDRHRHGHCISASSDTANCAAPLVAVMHQNFGVEEAMITAIHAVTADQRIVDGPTVKLWRSGRSALQNIIPSPTGTAKCIGKVIPELKNKVQAISFRVPVANVSVCDITFRVTQPTTYEQVKRVMRTAATGELKGVLNYTEDDCVSTDFNCTPYSCTFDAKAAIPLTSTFVKVVAWYDNEYGYANRVIDLILHMSSVDSGSVYSYKEIDELIKEESL